MQYYEVRNTCKTGDVLMVEGTGWVSTAIRMLTGQQISHVALLMWIGSSLYIAEMREVENYKLTPASERIPELQKGATVYYGNMDTVFTGQEHKITQSVLKYRDGKYGYLALIKVWWAQFTGRGRDSHRMVCSTFIQRVWRAAGHEPFTHLPDPGDFMRVVNYSAVIEKDDGTDLNWPRS